MAESRIGDDAYYDHLVLGADSIDVDEKGQHLTVEAIGDTNAHLGLYDVDKGFVDQSNSKIKVKGGDGKSTVLNRVDGCKDLEVVQDNTTSVIEATGNSKLTAVNHITNTENYKTTIRNSVIRIKPGNKSGVTAHTVIDGSSVVSINMTGSIVHIG